jgi:hypothetical protein
VHVGLEENIYSEMTVFYYIISIDQGGEYLDLKTPHDEAHYAYNR